VPAHTAVKAHLQGGNPALGFANHRVPMLRKCWEFCKNPSDIQRAGSAAARRSVIRIEMPRPGDVPCAYAQTRSEGGGRPGACPGSNAREQHRHRTRLGPIGMAGNRRCCLPGYDVVRGVEGSVDPSTPRISNPVVYRWQLEIERLPIRVQDHVEEESFLPEFGGERDAARTLAPVRLVQSESPETP